MNDIPAFRGLTSSGQPDFELPNTTQAISGQNGRVNFFPMPSAGGPPAKAEFTYSQTPDALAGQDLLRGNWSENPVSNAFFSVENMNWVQKEIVRQVHKRGGYEIDAQDIDEIKIIMRSMYLQYGKNLPTNISGQVADLNRLVVDWAVPRILSEISMYITYINDIDKLPVPMDRPVLMSSAGTKSKPFTHYM